MLFKKNQNKRKCFIVLQKALRIFDVALVVGNLRPPCWADAAGLLRRWSGVEEAEPEVGLLREVLQVEEVGDEVPPDQDVLAVAAPSAAAASAGVGASALAAAKYRASVLGVCDTENGMESSSVHFLVLFLE